MNLFITIDDVRVVHNDNMLRNRGGLSTGPNVYRWTNARQTLKSYVVMLGGICIVEILMRVSNGHIFSRPSNSHFGCVWNVREMIGRETNVLLSITVGLNAGQQPRSSYYRTHSEYQTYIVHHARSGL